jgi:hypothetical protein
MVHPAYTTHRNSDVYSYVSHTKVVRLRMLIFNYNLIAADSFFGLAH